MSLLKKAALLAACVFSTSIFAGVDINGPVTKAQMAPDGFYFLVTSASSSPYCKAGWAGLNMFVPKDHPEFFQYYGMVLSALAKAKNLYIANVDLGNNGSAPCDVTKSGYGIMMLQ